MTDWSRVSKLMGMLGSEHDGERLNAARLLQRALSSEGVSFGDLANRVNSGGGSFTLGNHGRVRERVVERVVIVEKRAKPNPAFNLACSLVDKAQGTGKLDTSDWRFLQNIMRKHDLTNGDFDLTPEQADRLASIEIRVLSEGPVLPKIKAKRGKTIDKSLLDDMGLGKAPKPDMDDHIGNFRASVAGERGEEKVQRDPQTVPHAKPGKYRGEFDDLTGDFDDTPF